MSMGPRHDFLPRGAILEDTVVPARGGWSGHVPAGGTLRIVDLEGQQAVDFLCFARAPHRDQVERYHAPNTIKIPCSVAITTGTVLYSQFARPLMTVIDDSVGGHDTLFGCCSFDVDRVRYGATNEECCQRTLEREMARHGLGPEHVVPNLNWFMNVPVGADGSAQIVDSTSRPGDSVTLRAEREVLCVLSNCPEELNAAAGSNGPTPIRVVIAAPVGL
ncbi:MAG: DUF1989 domain-containing protein [Pseudomonadota bacterium]